MEIDNYKHSDITEKTIKAFYKVYNTLGNDFSEKACQNALFIELESIGFSVKKQAPIKVYYEAQEVGVYFADLDVENNITIELKTKECICEEHEFQLKNYLKATEIKVGVLINFGRKPEVKRKLYSNNITHILKS